MANLSEDIQCVGSDTRPPMLDRTDFASCQQRIRLYCQGKENEVNILKSIDEGPFHMGTIKDTIAEGTEVGYPLHGVLSIASRDTASSNSSSIESKDLDSVVKVHSWVNVHGQQNRGQGNSAWGAGAASYGGAQNRVRNANPGQARQIKCYSYNGIGHIARNCTQSKRPQNSKYFKDKMLLMQAQENGVALDEEQLLFIAGGQDNAVDEDVDEQPVQDLALNVDNVFQANDCDAFDSDVDDMANLSSAYHVYDKVGSSYDSNILSEVHDHDHYQDVVCEHHEIHKMHDDVQPNYIVDSHADYMNYSNMIQYDQYLKDNAVPVVQSNNNVVDNSLTAELVTYKEQVELYERQVKFELTEREQKIDEQLRIVITDRNIKEENLKKELHSLKLQLTSTTNHNKSMVEEVTSLKKDFKHKENKFLEEFLDMKALKEKVEDKLYKEDQSLQTVHMLCKPKPYYDEQRKVAIGYKNPLCLTHAKQVQPALYNGYEIIKTNHVPAIVHNSEDILEIAEITRKKMNEKMKDPECVKKKVKIAPHDYSKENYLVTFTPQKQLTPEQIFCFKDLIKMNAESLKGQLPASRPIKVLMVYPPNTPATIVPRVLSIKSQVKINNFALIQLFLDFEKTCKKRITPTWLTEGERGFEQTKKCYLTEVIPFFKTLKEHFEGIQKALTKEVKEMKEIFEELEDEVDQNVVNRKYDEIERKNLLIANNNLIADCLSKEVFYIATNSKLIDNLKCITMDFVKPRVLTPGQYAIDVEPIPPHNRNNREVHLDYLKHIKESVETLCKIVKDARVERPLVSSLASACLYTKRSQERYQRKNQPYQAVPGSISTPPENQAFAYANQLDPNQNWGSNCPNSPSSSVFKCRNFVKRFIGKVRFGNDHFGAIMGYGDYVIGDSVISRVKHFRYTLLQHLGNVKKSVARKNNIIKDYERRVNKKIDARRKNIRPIYDEEPMAEVQLTVECNIFAIGQQHTEQPKIIVESRVDQYPETCQVKNPSCLIASAYNQTTEYSKQSLESENILIKKIVA
ncbi:hypothetical protein Tco_0004639 [Tanacetum coccineum]